MIYATHIVEHKNSIGHRHIATPVNSTQLSLISCSEVRCDYFGTPNPAKCYCCPDASRAEYCYRTVKECRANCALCKPKCLP